MLNCRAWFAKKLTCFPSTTTCLTLGLGAQAVARNILTDRDQQIAQIARGVQEIAELFRDLSHMTIEQVRVFSALHYCAS